MRAGVYFAPGIGNQPPIRAAVQIYASSSDSTESLLDRLGVHSAGVFGRPRIAPVAELDGGMSVVTVEETCAGTLSLRVAVVRREGDHEIVVRAAAVPVNAFDEILTALVELSATLREPVVPSQR